MGDLTEGEVLQWVALNPDLAARNPGLTPSAEPEKKPRTEAEFQDEVIRKARKLGWKVAHFRAVRIQRLDGSVYYATPVQADGEGFPDLIMTRGRAMLAIECKIGTNKPSAKQSEWLNHFAMIAGCRAEVWHPSRWPHIEAVLLGDACR